MFPTKVNQPLKFFQTYSDGWLHAGDPVTEEIHDVNLIGDFLPSLVS